MVSDILLVLMHDLFEITKPDPDIEEEQDDEDDLVDDGDDVICPSIKSPLSESLLIF